MSDQETVAELRERHARRSQRSRQLRSKGLGWNQVAVQLEAEGLTTPAESGRARSAVWVLFGVFLLIGIIVMVTKDPEPTAEDKQIEQEVKQAVYERHARIEGRGPDGWRIGYPSMPARGDESNE